MPAQNQNVRRFLDLISAAEGTTQHGYHTLFGGGRLDSLDTHPNRMSKFKDGSGRRLNTSAAGRYQIIGSVWNNLAEREGLEDFSPESQDRAAISLIREKGALEDVEAGNFREAIEKLGSIWAALPSSTYDQPKKDWNWVEDFLAATPPERSLVESAQDAVFSRLSPELVEQIRAAAGAVGTALTSPQAQGGMTIYDEPSWEDAVMGQTIQQDADTARSKAVADFMGADHVPDLTLPKPLEKLISNIVAEL